MAHDFWIAIHGERGEEWQQITGTNKFPVKSPFPIPADLPGVGVRLVYSLELREVPAWMLQLIVKHMAGKFGLTDQEAELEMKTVGIPILDEDCTLVISGKSSRFML